TDGARTLLRTPRAIGPITSISIDSMGQGIILTVAAVVFREQFKEGVGSYSNLVGAGGVGVLMGIVTVGWLEERWSKERIIAGALVIPLVPAIGTHGTVALVSLLFIAWAPVLPRWIGGVADVRIVFSEGAREEEWPRAVRWGAAEESVDVIKAWLEERSGE